MCVEHCFGCSEHGTSLRHDENRYLMCSNKVLRTTVDTILGMRGKYHFIRRVFAFRIKPLESSRLGALELTVAFKNRKYGGGRGAVGSIPLEPWTVKRLHSKLNTLRYARFTILLIHTFIVFLAAGLVENFAKLN